MAKLIKLWIVGSAVCVSAGWVLSCLREVNARGYAVYFGVLAFLWLAIYLRWRAMGRMGEIRQGIKWPHWNIRRLRRPLPLLFLLTAFLAFLGGAIHAPNNYDALTYRFPRMLHWYAAGGWHWIPTPNERMNLSGTGFEWLMMPIYIFTHSDRLFFLINVIAYLFLPSLVFVVFVACGMKKRAAWFWMWVLPAALCYAMQAGSISNDTIAATYFLSALYFAFRARQSRAVRDVWLSILAAGVLTGVKASNLPLLLPVAWAVFPVIPILDKRFLASAAVVLFSASVSFLPSAALNHCYTGDWSGDPHNIERIKLSDPLAGILGNGLQLGLQCLEPPFLPVARTVENWVWDSFPRRLQAVLKEDFPRFVVGFRELPQEESAGMGIGITALAIISIVAAIRHRRKNPARRLRPAQWQGLMVGGLTWVALMVYMAKLGSESTSRLIAAYYPLLLMVVLLGDSQCILVRKRWYRALGVATALIALMAVILTPSRPLWPAERFFDWATHRFPRHHLLNQAARVYQVYHSRNDLLAPLRQAIPNSVKVIGLIEGGDDPEASLWRPYGERRVVHVPPGDIRQERKLEWLVVKNTVFTKGEKDPGAFDRWLKKDGGTLVTQQMLIEKASSKADRWSVVRFSSL